MILKDGWTEFSGDVYFNDCVIAVALANTDSWGTATYIGGRTSNNKWLEEDEEGD